MVMLCCCLRRLGWPLAPAAQCHLRSQLAVRREYAVVTGEVHSRLGHQGRQSGHEIQRIEKDVGRAIAIRGLERVTHMTAVRQGDAFIGHGGASNVAAQPFQLGPVIRARPYARVQREASRFGQTVVSTRLCR